MTGPDDSPPSPHTLDGSAPSATATRASNSRPQRPSLKQSRQHVTFPSPQSSSPTAAMRSSQSRSPTLSRSSEGVPQKLKRHSTVGTVPHSVAGGSVRASAFTAAPSSVSKRKSQGSKVDSPTLEASSRISSTAGSQSSSAKSSASSKTPTAAYPQSLQSPSLRTPSYPFPHVPTPGRPRPTGLGGSSTGVQYWSKQSQGEALSRHASISSTPGTAIPYGTAPTTPFGDDSDFPSPDLNNLILQLNSDPDLEYWWGVTCEAMRDWYRAKRVSLSIPADSNDIENVPWGQKASFDASGLKDRSETSQSSQPSVTTSTSSIRGSHKGPKSDVGSARPSLRGRQHSSPAHGSRGDAYSSTPANKPGTYARSLWDYPVGADIPESPLSDETTQIFSSLRPLDAEIDSLLDSWGVNPVLERGRTVVLSREYPLQENANVQMDELRSDKDDKRGEQTPTDAQRSNFRPSVKGKLSNRPSTDRVTFSDATAESGGSTRRSSNFEEYEQIPASPWSQSPAPSPAMLADPEENPFFASGTLDEESFSTPTREDYQGYEQVEAIGVDQGVSTVVHIPLIHPLLSRIMRPISAKDDSQASFRQSGSHTHEEETVRERRAPIAILSIQAYVVPYPRSLLESLDALAPHLATSFHTCNLTAARVPDMNRRKSLSATEGGLGNLLQLELDDSSSSTGFASPSDRSVRSLSGTPHIQDTWSLGISAKKYPVGIPGAASLEASESYFDSRKRMALSRAHSTGYVPQMNASAASQPTSSSSNRPTTSEHRPMSKLGKETDLSSAKPEKWHSVLHSFGADFASSFPSLPVTAVPHTPGSQSGDVEMAPPSEKLLRTIIDSLPVQIFTAAPDSGAITYVNSKFLVYRGQNPFHGTQTPRQVLAIHEEDLAPWLQAWDRSLRTGQEFQQKVRLRRFDDTYRWFYIKTGFLRDRHQKIVHVIGTCMDFHEQYIAEISAARAQETVASEAKYRALANSSPQIVFAATRKKGVTFCNSQWLEYSGQSEEDAIHTGFMDHVHPEDIVKCKLPSFDDNGSANVPVSVTDSKRFRSLTTSPISEHFEDSSIAATSLDTSTPTGMPQRKLSQLAGTGIMKVSQDETGRPSYSTEVRLRNKSGEYRWHLVRVLPADSLMNDESEEETWFGSCADINDHKELEKTLKETMDAKSRFLSNMSHEIRTPLNGIHGMSQILIDSSNLTAEQMEHLNVIRASTEGLRDLINDILDLSKVEAGMITLNKDWLHVRSTIEEVNDLTAPLIMDRNIDLNYIVEQEVPAHVIGDKFRIRQVLLNVIGNAIKFTQEGEVLVRCSLMPKLKGNAAGGLMLQFDVTDTGRGFTDKEAERLFKRFSQIDGSSTRQHGGSGLGLVISMQLVELHGGTMTAIGHPGKGSTFTFTVNVGMGDDPQDAILKDRRPSIPDVVLPPMQSQISIQQTALQAITQSPGQLETPSLSSSGSSDPLIRSSYTSNASKSSSLSSVGSSLSMPSNVMSEDHGSSKETPPSSLTSSSTQQTPMLYSVVVVCPLKWAREAAMKHLENSLPREVPHQTTSCESAEQCRQMMTDQRLKFSHIIAVIQDSEALMSLVDQVFKSPARTLTSIIAVTGLAQKQEIVETYTQWDFGELSAEGRLRFVFKPLKVSKLSEFFDPLRSKGLNTDLNQTGSQRVAKVQKQVFDDMAQRLGNKGHKVLLVEDNKVNQLVMLKLLKRTSIDVDTASDGKQCTDKFFDAEAGYYSIVLCDLHMPVKDGYQTCRDIRKFERAQDRSHIPIIALSANVLGDVYAKCAAAGFNSYLTKPVEFKELSEVMTSFLDRDPKSPLEFMH